MSRVHTVSREHSETEGDEVSPEESDPSDDSKHDEKTLEDIIEAYSK